MSAMAATGTLSPLARTAYRWSQNLRLGWFGAQYALTRRLTDPVPVPAHLKAAMPSARQLTADRARPAQHRRRLLSPAPRPHREPRGGLPAEPRLFRRPAEREPPPARRGGTGDRKRGGRALSRLLPARLPSPDRRLSQRAVGAALRLSGRDPLRRCRRRHAAAG